MNCYYDPESNAHFIFVKRFLICSRYVSKVRFNDMCLLCSKAVAGGGGGSTSYKSD